MATSGTVRWRTVPALRVQRDALLGAPDDAGQVLGRGGPSHEVTLQGVAADLGQPLGGALVLDALGDDPQAQVVTQVDGAADDGHVAGLGELLDEPLVDLELVDGQPLQVAQRGVPGAEVVDRDLDAEHVQPAEDARALRGVGHQPALGDLEHEPLRRDRVAGEVAGDDLGQVVVADLAGRQVHAGRQPQALGVPRRELAQRGVEDPVQQQAGERRALRDRDERVRRDLAELGVAPPGQALDRVDRPRRQVRLRLEGHPELVVGVVLQGGAQVRLQAEQHRGVPVELLAVDHGGVADRLGVVERDVGAPQQVGDRLRVVGTERDADRAADRDRHAVQDHRFAQDRAHPLGERLGLGRIADHALQDDELVAAQPGHEVVRSGRPRAAGRRPG